MSYVSKWSEVYWSPDRRVRVTLHFERALGDTDTSLQLYSTVGGGFSELEPAIAGMAVSRDGRLLYLQSRDGDERERRTYDLAAGKPLPGEPHPSRWDEITLLSDFVPNKGDGDVYACNPAFVLTKPPDFDGESLSDGERMTQLGRLLGQSPSPETWVHLMALFRHWPEPAASKGLDLAEQGLSKWPTEFRRKPSWLEWYGSHPVWRLVADCPEVIIQQHQPMGDAGAERFAASHLLPRVVRLALIDCQIGPAGVAAISASEQLRGLRELSLADNPIGNDGATALAASPHVTLRERLDLVRCGVGPSGIAALGSSSILRHLKKLDLSANPVGDEGAAALAAALRLSSLKELVLADCGVGPAGVRALGGSRNVCRLSKLDLTGNPIGEEGITALQNAPVLAGKAHRAPGPCQVRHDVRGTTKTLWVKRKR